MEAYPGVSGIELRSRTIPQLALQGTRGALVFSAKGHPEEGTWPLGPGDVGIRAGFVVRNEIRPVGSPADADGYLIRSSVSLGNGARTVHLHSFCPLAVDYVSDGVGSITPRYTYRHGWQSWSGSGSFKNSEIDRDPPFHFLRMLSTNPGDIASGRPGHFMSEMFTVIRAEKGRGAILAGFLDTADYFGQLFVSFDRGRCRLQARVQLDDHLLEQNKSIQIPDLIVLFGSDEQELVETYAARLSERMNARVPDRHYSGWCSWYHYYTRVTEDDTLRNLETACASPDQYPVDVFQIDDGFQPVIGDWLNTNAKFPAGMPSLAERVNEKGLIPGIWLAPFLVSPTSKICREHPDWLLRNNFGRPLRACWNPNWKPRTQFALDPTHPGVQEHLTRLFHTITNDWGYRYVKIDFLYAAALPARRHNPRFSRAGALRVGLKAIRDGCGNDTFILGCGCPLGPAIGLVDGMRIGTDVAPFWNDWLSRHVGRRFHFLSTENAIRNILTRAFMHRRLWLNDPDCMMLRHEGTKLSVEETRALATAIAVSGGMALISDDLVALDPARAGLFTKLVEIMRDQPSGPETTEYGPRTYGLMSGRFPEIFYRRGQRHDYIAFFNPMEKSQWVTSDLSRFFPERSRFPHNIGEFWTSEQSALRGSILETSVPPHGARLFILGK